MSYIKAKYVRIAYFLYAYTVTHGYNNLPIPAMAYYINGLDILALGVAGAG